MGSWWRRQSLAYEMTKAAIIAMSRQMALDFGPIGVRVNCICPGHIVTERQRRTLGEQPLSAAASLTSTIPCATPACPTTSPMRCASSALSEAGFITGHTMVVDGGMTIQLQENLVLNTARYFRDNPEIDLDT